MGAPLTPGAWNRHRAAEASPRLDTYLAQHHPELSRSRAQKLIDEGHVKKNAAAAKASAPVEAGDEIEVFLPAPRPLGLRAEEIPLRILFQDDQLAVVEKPAGLVVHPAAGHEDGTLVNALLHHFPDLSTGAGIGGQLRPGIVHRIDRQTSGILLITKTDRAHQHLSAQFKDHSISRRYQGLCWGPLPEKGAWDLPIARDPKERKRMAIVPGGRRALTHYRRVAAYGGGALCHFEAELFTGRTHQIRVHFSADGFPLVGDAVYATSGRSARQAREAGRRKLLKTCAEAVPLVDALEERGRQFLHAAHLGFVHPVSGRTLSFDSDLPADLAEIMLRLKACSPT